MKRFVLGTFGLFGRGLRNGLVAIGALAFAGGIIAVADYTATQGTGLTFASLVISAKHYAAFVLCDATAGESQCSAVKAGNTAIVADVAQVVADPNVLAAINSSIPAGTNNIGAVEVLDSGGTNKLTVKAASTPSVATDTGAVVDVRPSCGACITLGGATPANSVPTVPAGYTYAHVAAGQATTVIKGSAGVLHSITLNSAATATNTTTVYDNPTTSGTIIAIPAATTATIPVTLTYDVAFANGLTIITATANGGDMTVSYR